MYLLNSSGLAVIVLLVSQLKITEITAFECGTADVLAPRIKGGNATDRGEWPYLTALYYVEEMEFFCGGTLISMKHVLTGTNEFPFVINLLTKTFQLLIVFIGNFPKRNLGRTIF